MPKYRQLHTKIIDSFDFAEMPDDFTRLFWILLIVVVDSEGRGINNPSWLRSRIYPLRDDVSLDDISAVMLWLEQRQMIRIYEVGTRSYFEIPTFKTYQSGTSKEASSNIPANPDLLQSNSVPTPELLPTKSASDADADADADSNTDSYADADADTKAAAEVYRTYTSEIGLLTPMISDDIDDAIKTYPKEWIIEAIKEAARNNARTWKYILAILKRWKVDGFKAVGKGRNNGVKPATNDTLRRLEARRTNDSN